MARTTVAEVQKQLDAEGLELRGTGSNTWVVVATSDEEPAVEFRLSPKLKLAEVPVWLAGVTAGREMAQKANKPEHEGGDKR